MSENHTPVLIVGGGIAGLSSALFLSWHGVSCVLVERHPDLLLHPRARGLTPRTVELYRQVGLERAVHEATYAGGGFTWTPVTADTLSDDVYETPDEPQEDDGSDASPTGFAPIDQDKLEPLVRARARELGATLRFHTELTSFEQHTNGVTAVLTDRGTGAERTIEADYLVAADGFHSPVRADLGIGVDGPGTMFHTITALIDADLTPALRGRAASIAYLQQPRPFTILMAHDGEGRRWIFGTGYDPVTESLEDFPDKRVVEMVRAAAGLADVPVALRPQIPGTGLKVLGFPIGAHIARSYRAGRAFLVGDAAHIWPPTGGLGANAGIQDAHNLAWKLAMVVKGKAGPGLLDSYHEERRAVGLLTMEQALARFGTRMGPDKGPDLIDYGAVAMGYQYRSAAVVGAAGDADPVPPRRLDGRPGTRAPHAAVAGNGAEMSTLDLYGSGFVLLAGPEGKTWARAAGRLGIAAYRFGADLTDASPTHGLASGGALLVRPDGFVAWRGAAPAADPATELEEVLNRAPAAGARAQPW